MQIIDFLKSLITHKKKVSPKKVRYPEIGDVWILRLIKGDPWDSKCITAKVLDVKNDWVRYYSNPIFNDERLQLETFIAIYRFSHSKE